MYLRSFLRVKVQKWGIFGGGGLLKFRMFFGVLEIADICLG